MADEPPFISNIDVCAWPGCVATDVGYIAIAHGPNVPWCADHFRIDSLTQGEQVSLEPHPSWVLPDRSGFEIHRDGFDLTVRREDP